MVGERVSKYTKSLADGFSQSTTGVAERVTTGKPLYDTGKEMIERGKARRRDLLGL